jgi:hypothetical protein
MCNGANLAYTKSLFTALNGFDGNDGIASETMCLLQKQLPTHPTKYMFKTEKYNCIYKTSRQLTALFHQRVRWHQPVLIKASF